MSAEQQEPVLDPKLAKRLRDLTDYEEAEQIRHHVLAITAAALPAVIQRHRAHAQARRTAFWLGVLAGAVTVALALALGARALPSFLLP